MSITNLEGKYKQCLDFGNINVNMPHLVLSTEKYVGRNIFPNSRSQGVFLHMKTDKVFNEIDSTNLLVEKHSLTKTRKLLKTRKPLL